MASHVHYDIFLSYQWNNQEQIKSFSKTLKDSFGYSVFLDINNRISGTILSAELKDEINVIVMILLTLVPLNSYVIFNVLS